MQLGGIMGPHKIISYVYSNMSRLLNTGLNVFICLISFGLCKHLCFFLGNDVLGQAYCRPFIKAGCVNQ